ncbi:coiled-coil domain-containing protein 134-like [Diorhabda carinulata]|uniref:coiled-coil domain-containing protein 134-like n=1 Tax=Diorhabda carinulata TaxID=1163345 RepID=UPI0025A1B808|nr:coiled-coil domain-containing protein 134-like [Diorhabda carinulata]
MLKFRYLLFLFFGFYIVSSAEKGNEESLLAEELYKKLYKQQRREQLDAIKKFQKLSNHKKQYSTINLMSQKIFETIINSRVLLESSSFIPGVSNFPLEEKIREALSNILENTALFSELVLRFPEISSNLLKSNNNWNLVFQWGIAFSYQMKYLLDENTITLLKLVGQELNHTERDPNYVNPYRKAPLKRDNVEVIPPKKKLRRVIKKGPKLSVHNEL